MCTVSVLHLQELLSCIAFSSAGNFLTTLPRVPSVTVVSQPAGLAPGEESPGVSLLPALSHWHVFTLVSLKKQTKTKHCFSDSYSFRHKSVLGPLIIVAPSEAPNAVQVIAQVWWWAMIQATGTNLWFYRWQEIVAWAETLPGTSDGCSRPPNLHGALTLTYCPDLSLCSNKPDVNIWF